MSDIQIEMRRINTIKPYVRNPRRNQKTVEMLMKLIPKVGFNVPIVVDEKGIIVKGHARFTAAIRLGMQEVPVIVSHADEEAIKADRITDNKISEFSEWVNDELMDEINSIDFDLSDIGLPKINLDDTPGTEEIKNEIASEVKPVPAATSNYSHEISEEKKQEIFKEFEKEQQQQAQAAESFGEEPYYKCVCDKCGYVMFIKEGEL